MIWDIIQESTFDNHFKNQSLQLEDLLVDENMLTQMKNLNPSLLQYLQDNIQIVMGKLITYITTIPDASQSYDRCYKLPYISSEMLAIDNDIFYEAFLGKLDHEHGWQQGKGFVDISKYKNLDRLLSFLKNSETVNNELLLGYFEKVINNLHKGRKIQFSQAIIDNSQIFLNNMDKQSIGTILTKCLILIDTEQGVLLKKRMNLLQKIVKQLQIIQETEIITDENLKKYQVGSNIVIEVIGKFKTFSSGQQLVHSLFNSNQSKGCIAKLLNVPNKANQTFRLAIYQMIIGMLNKTKQKIYDPKTDNHEFIFVYPKPIQQQLVQIVLQQIQVCQKIQKEGSNLIQIKYQNRQGVRPISKIVFNYFNLISVCIQNKIWSFLQDKQASKRIIYLAFSVFQNHPKNDVLLVSLDKILTFSIKSIQYVQKQFCLSGCFHNKIVELYKSNFKLYRPHLFQIWLALTQVNMSNNNAPIQIVDSQPWKNIQNQFGKLKKIYSLKASVTQIERPKDVKLVIDEEDVITKATTDDHHEKMSKISHAHVASEKAHEIHEISKKQDNKQQKKKLQKTFDPFADFDTTKKSNNNSQDNKKQVKVDFSSFMNF